MRPLLFVAGCALIGGAELQPELGRLITQAASGLVLIMLALSGANDDNEVN